MLIFFPQIKYQILKIKIAELPFSGNDFLNFALCILIFHFLYLY